MEVWLIPFAKGYLLVPADLVERSFPYAPYMKYDETSRFVLGGIVLANEKIPLLDFSDENADNIPPHDTEKSRLVLLSSITSDCIFERYAVIAYDEPKKIALNKEADIENVDENQSLDNYFVSEVKINKVSYQPIYLPNLLLIEKELKMV